MSKKKKTKNPKGAGRKKYDDPRKYRKAVWSQLTAGSIEYHGGEQELRKKIQEKFEVPEKKWLPKPAKTKEN